jgi:hypothetical protein
MIWQKNTVYEKNSIINLFPIIYINFIIMSLVCNVQFDTWNDVDGYSNIIRGIFKIL